MNSLQFYVQLRKFLLGSGVLLFLLADASAVADTATAPKFHMPIDCEIGTDCWLVNLVDRDPGSGRTDYRCGSISYDGHRGTDIAIANLAVMRRGVNVIAAAPGTVLRVRDGMPATALADLKNRSGFRGRECGNGVVIDHGHGWSTQYCHLKAGSLSVSPGVRVNTGDPLGEVGLSGLSEFPHVHLAVRYNQTIIDPFTGDSNVAACARTPRPTGLWHEDAADALRYPGPQPYHLGFATGRPNVEKLRAGGFNKTTFPRTASAVVFWAEAFTLNKNDEMTLRLIAPDGSTVAESTTTVDRPQARRFGFVGRKRPAKGWPTGDYRGVIQILRDGKIVQREATARIN